MTRKIPARIVGLLGIALPGFWATRPVLAQCQMPTKLLASDGQPGDLYALRVALSGPVLLVGSLFHDHWGDNAGAAYFYQWDGTEWGQGQEVQGFDTTTGDRFGNMVAVRGDVALIGAYVNNQDAGSVYFFHFNGVEWVEDQEFFGAAGSNFGASLALGDDVAIVGAPTSGSATTFRFNGSSWELEQPLQPVPPAASFGDWVALNGDVAVIGAHLDESAYVFRFNGAGWVQEQRLTAKDGVAGDDFGAAIAVGGDVALISARDDDNENGADAGAVYVFRHDGLGWNEEQKFHPVPPDVGFGQLVELQGDVALVSSNESDDSGSVYLFRFDGTDWIQEQKIDPTDGQPGDRFGVGLALDNDVAVIGAFQDDEFGTNSGSVYSFDFEPPILTGVSVGASQDGTVGTSFVSVDGVGATNGDSFVDAGPLFLDGETGGSILDGLKIAGLAQADVHAELSLSGTPSITITASATAVMAAGYSGQGSSTFSMELFFEIGQMTQFTESFTGNPFSFEPDFDSACPGEIRGNIASAGAYRISGGPFASVVGVGPMFDDDFKTYVLSFPDCPWDCGNADGTVGIVDLLQALADWGTASPCDFDGDRVVAIVDLLGLLAHWGACP